MLSPLSKFMSLTSRKQQFVPQSETHLNLAKHKICESKTSRNLLHNLKYNNLNRGEAKLELKKRTIFIITENSSIIAKPQWNWGSTKQQGYIVILDLRHISSQGIEQTQP